jgi:hypothetical protein
MASGVILPHREVPFSNANFHALRVGAPLRTARETQSLVLLEQGGVDAHDQREKAKIARAREYEGRCNEAFRFWQWVALGLAVVFIAAVVVMISVICIRLNETFEAVQSLSGSSSSESSSIKQIVEHAVQSAENVNVATANMARATGLAHATAAMAAPQLARAMNETVGIVDDLRSFSFHPQWTVSTGGVMPVSRRSRS